MKEKSSTRKIVVRTVLSVLSGLVLLGSAASAAGMHLSERLSANIAVIDIDSATPVGTTPSSAPPEPSGAAAPSASPDPSATTVPSEETTGPLNILLMGSDTREGDNSNYGDPSVHSTSRSDVTILLHVSADRTWATAVSIPRDTWVTLPTCKGSSGAVEGGYEGKFNAAYQYGGPACTVRLVEEISGVDIDHFVVIDFTGVERVIDAFGGLEVCLDSAVMDDASGLSLPAGLSRLDGKTALSFLRARKGLSDGSDLARIGRQQQFLNAFAREAIDSRLLLDPLRLYAVADAATASLTTDRGLGSLEALVSTAYELRDLRPSQIFFLTAPWVPRGDGENVVLDSSRADMLWAALQQDEKAKVAKKAPGSSDLDTEALVCD